LTVVASKFEGVEVGEPLEDAREVREFFNIDTNRVLETVGYGKEPFGDDRERLQLRVTMGPVVVAVAIFIHHEEFEYMFPTVIR
jgi:hypothetical protein